MTNDAAIWIAVAMYAVVSLALAIALWWGRIVTMFRNVTVALRLGVKA